MKLLALDTATEACSAALLLDDRLILREAEFERGHAEHILPMVDAVLAEGGVGLPQLDAIAFGRGPGGFTGVRLAASVAQGLAFGASLPVVPISDLAAVAQRVLDLKPGAQRVLVCSDARMREVYWGCFQREGGRAVARGPEQVSPPAKVAIPPDWPSIGFEAAGRGFRAYPELERSLAGIGKVHDELLPRAAEVARLAVAEVLGGRVLPAEQALPVYLRDNVARPSS